MAVGMFLYILRVCAIVIMSFLHNFSAKKSQNMVQKYGAKSGAKTLKFSTNLHQVWCKKWCKNLEIFNKFASYMVQKQMHQPWFLIEFATHLPIMLRHCNEHTCERCEKMQSVMDALDVGRAQKTGASAKNIKKKPVGGKVIMKKPVGDCTKKIADDGKKKKVGDGTKKTLGDDTMKKVGDVDKKPAGNKRQADKALELLHDDSLIVIVFVGSHESLLAPNTTRPLHTMHVFVLKDAPSPN